MDKTKTLASEYDEKVRLAMSKGNEELAKKRQVLFLFYDTIVLVIL